MPELPEVEALAHHLREHAVGATVTRVDVASLTVLKTVLGERDLLLFPDNPVETGESAPRARSRRLIGYVTRDPEVMALALVTPLT